MQPQFKSHFLLFGFRDNQTRQRIAITLIPSFKIYVLCYIYNVLPDVIFHGANIHTRSSQGDSAETVNFRPGVFLTKHP